MQSVKPDTPSKGPSLCLWMQAGVVPYKLCKEKYLCPTCHYDRVLRNVANENRIRAKHGQPRSGRKGRIIFWKNRLKERPPHQRPCIHHLKGNIAFRICTNEYACGNCDFDQYFQDQYTVHTVIRNVESLNIKGIEVPQGYYLHSGHMWVKIEEEGFVRVGIDDFALRMLGPLDCIQAPLTGKTVTQNQKEVKLIRNQNSAYVQSPVSGVVTDINPLLREKGRIANENPYTDGWVIRVHANDLRHDLKKLMIGKESSEFISADVDDLFEVIEEYAGPLAADGGDMADDISGNVPGLEWDILVKRFL